MRRPFTTLLLLSSLIVVGCGGSSTASSDGAGSSSNDTTSGGEAEQPRTLYTTTPVPVPQPAVARDRLSQPVQATWLEIEQAIAQRPPEPPSASDGDALTVWYRDAFGPWLTGRLDARTRAEGHAAELEGAAPFERGVAAGLVGYFQEQTMFEVRGAPIPDSIAGDAELLAVYTRSLDEALAPMALRAVEAFRFCMGAFDELGEGLAPWQEWRDWCQDRGEEIVRVYSHQAEPADEPEADVAASPQ